MNFRCLVFSLCMIPFVASAAITPEERTEGLRALNWHEGPQTETIAAKATLKTNADLLFLDEANSKKFFTLTDNIPEDGNFILLSKAENWWATFSFSPMGYVKDDEKIDADAILQSMKDNDGPANEERKKLGIPALTTVGWAVPPHYDTATKRLEWGVKLQSQGVENVNYSIRILGRTGVMNAILVSNPTKLDQDVQSFKAVLPNFEFNSGERYAEFRAGDHVAEIGLGALITGGALAVATKKGFWAVLATSLAAFWKIIAGVCIAGAAGVRSLFKRKQS